MPTEVQRAFGADRTVAQRRTFGRACNDSDVPGHEETISKHRDHVDGSGSYHCEERRDDAISGET